MKKQTLIFFSILSFISSAFAQQSATTSGGEASGTGGTSSYSIGQTDFTTISSSSGTVSQGVQQPYEIFVTSALEEAKGVDLKFLAYPNPTADFLTLTTENFEKQNLSFQLFDLAGKQLLKENIAGSASTIPMKSYANSTYFLKIFREGKEIKTFQIIKSK